METSAEDPALKVRLAQYRRNLPMLEDLEKRAKRRVPAFIYDFVQGGAGNQSGLSRNRKALQDIEAVPRYGVDVSKIDTSVDLFGTHYTGPIGISPIGFDGLMWPGATRLFAQAAQQRKIPYLCGTLATETIETVARLAPDVTWFQLYPLPADDHRMSFDLADRAHNAGAKVLVATLDVPVRSKRPRDMRNGFSMPFKIRTKNITDVMLAPPWFMALARCGMPTFANIEAYSKGRQPADFVAQHVSGGFDWEVLARLRDKWKRPLMVKGVMHPKDAEKALELGLDGVLVSNHGGRQFDSSPASADMLPAIKQVVGSRMKVMLDSGVASGVDVMKAVALGADTTFSGRAFMLALQALGNDGAHHMIETMLEELRSSLGQCGVTTIDAARSLDLLHKTAWKL